MMINILKNSVKIAHLAGNRIKELRENNSIIESEKNEYELVTTADIEANAIIKSEILNLFPCHNYISEEEEKNDLKIDEPTWIIDPVDGTVGYANYQYQVAISIAFASDNEVKAGVVYNPFLNETFTAIKGQGAFLNNNRIHVKNTNSLQKSVIGTGFPHDKKKRVMAVNLLHKILPEIRDLRRFGSPALDICWVACGRLHGFYEGELSPWDVAAAKLSAKEAGAMTGYYADNIDSNIPDDLNGGNIIVSSPEIFNELKQILAS